MDDMQRLNLRQLRELLGSGAEEAREQLAYLRGLFRSMDLADEDLPFGDIIPGDLDFAVQIARGLTSEGVLTSHCLALVEAAREATTAVEDWSAGGLETDSGLRRLRDISRQALAALPSPGVSRGATRHGS